LSVEEMNIKGDFGDPCVVHFPGLPVSEERAKRKEPTCARGHTS
jgi:hypothetical protein